MTFPEKIGEFVSEQPHPFLFVTISGAHLYGFESPDSDFDIRGCHVLPVADVIGLKKAPETIDATVIREGVELDLVSHDAAKFFLLMLKKNGYVLEQVFSPLVLETGEDHERLKVIARKCITKFHGHHYRGFARNQWKLFTKEDPPRVKPLLYIYRVLLTGIHLLRTGEVEANLPNLNDVFRLPYIEELIQKKLAGPEKGTLVDADLAFHRGEYERLLCELEEAEKTSALPESAQAADELDQFLVELRLR